MGNKDTLTGLYTKDYFYEQYDQFMKTHLITTVLAIDFTKLKFVNDNYGHAGGDTCLSSFGEIIEKTFPNDICVRRSGDEFLILTDKTNEEIEKGLKRTDELINEYFIIGNIPFRYGFNTGIAKAEHSIELSLDKADMTMYDAKKRNQLYAYYSDEIYNESKKGKILLSQIGDDIKKRKLNYNYRDIYTISGQITDIHDVYTRDHNNQIIFSETSLELFKKSIYLNKLDYENLKRILLSSSQVGEKLIINIDATTLLSKNCETRVSFGESINFMAFISALCSISDNDMHNYILCLNVDNLGDDWEKIIPTLMLLKDLGFGLAIGRFNAKANNPSINIWQQNNLDIDFIKINKQTISDAMQNEKIAKIIRALTTLMDDYGTTPIFMKIENEEELAFTKNLNEKGLIIGNVMGPEKKLILKKNKTGKL